MKALILCSDYPNNQGGKSLAYVHTRNMYYKEFGIDVTVLNFNTMKKYDIDGIQVISLKDYLEKKDFFDVLICHAANIRNHYRFLKRYQTNFKHVFFFFHGHEVLKVNQVYSKPFPFVKQNYVKDSLRDLYDTYKLHVWGKYFALKPKNIELVFVSEWMKKEFLKWTKISPELIKNNSQIIYNGVGKIFEEKNYDDVNSKKYDFITIRGNLDNSKYAIDIVNELAKYNPTKKFLLIGKGDFFKYFEKAPNIEWKETLLSQDEIIEYLDQAKYALMPTRTDAQGLMMCEMAAYGIPVITSNIPVCHEVFDDFENVKFIDNNGKQYLNNVTDNWKSYCVKDNRYNFENTIKKEIELIKNIATKD